MVVVEVVDGGRRDLGVVAGEGGELLGHEAHDEVVEGELLVVGGIDVGAATGRRAAGAVGQEHEPGTGRLGELAEDGLGLVVALGGGDREDLDAAGRRRRRSTSG